MLNLTNVMIQTTATGHNIRARDLDRLELHVGSNDAIAATIIPAVYDVTIIQCDVDNDTIKIFDEVGLITVLDGATGTKVLINNVVVLADEKKVSENTYRFSYITPLNR